MIKLFLSTRHCRPIPSAVFTVVSRRCQVSAYTSILATVPSKTDCVLHYSKTRESYDSSKHQTHSSRDIPSSRCCAVFGSYRLHSVESSAPTCRDLVARSCILHAASCLRTTHSTTISKQSIELLNRTLVHGIEQG